MYCSRVMPAARAGAGPEAWAGEPGGAAADWAAPWARAVAGSRERTNREVMTVERIDATFGLSKYLYTLYYVCRQAFSNQRSVMRSDHVFFAKKPATCARIARK